LKLTGATEIPVWAPPSGCTASGKARAFVRSDADLAKVLMCPKGTSLGVDWTKRSIVFVPAMLSPQGLGFKAYDDGKTVTHVSMYSTPCPDEPRIAGTPVENPSWYVVPDTADRTVAETGCREPCSRP
jgi:hypothetical protein